jgi:undecaprenyl-diphosphatase
MNQLLRRMSQAEIHLCLVFNRSTHLRGVGRLFAVVSRLGNGVFWYLLMAALPLLYGRQGLWVALHMGAVGLVALPVYKWLKTRTLRHRPCDDHNGILCGAPPLDQFSFPSGHTMHAVAFTTVLVAYLPEWAVLVVPFTLLVALSRLVLGLHYPSDVLAGAGIGATLAAASLALVGAA